MPMDVRQPIKSDLHTHTAFCDGSDSPEEMVLAALALGMETIGCSGHSFVPVARACMSRDGTMQYCRELERLKGLYGDRIHILTGMELDLYGERGQEPLDYLIGSVHYLCLNGEFCAIDNTENLLVEAVRRHCRGDIYRLIREYYRSVATLVDVTGCDIIGHFDVISKFNADGKLFDEGDPRYLHAALEALDALLERDVIFEINTGAMARGYRKAPYPAPILLRRIAEKGGRVTFSSDAHCKAHLLYAFPTALSVAKNSGIRSIEVMTRNGWSRLPIRSFCI